jgi:hypothetical protein
VSELRSRILVSALATLCTAPVGYVARRAIGASRILDPLSDWLGEWLRMNATAQVEWVTAGIITAAAYAVALWFIWRHFHAPVWGASEGTTLAQSIREAVETEAPKLKPIEHGEITPAKADTRAAPVLQRSRRLPIAEVPTVLSPPATPAPPTPPVKPRRTFVDANVTPEFLVGLYEGNTALRAETLISEQKDKWMLVSGPLGEIHSGHIFPGSRTPTLVVFAFRKEKEPNVYMWFSGEWIDRLALLPKNKNISVVGQIKKVVGYNATVELDNCELIDINPTTNAPTRSPSSSPRSRRSRPR